MKKAFSYALVLLASLSAARSASASGPGAPAGQAGSLGEGDGALFFVGGAATTHGAQGYLGVDVRDVTADQAGPLKLKEARGAEIIQVDHDAPAGKVGLREHDVVLQMNGQAIAGEDQIRRMLHETAPGRTIVLVISRDGQQITVTAQMANREAVERQAWEQHLTVPGPQDAPSSETDSSSLPSGPAAPSPMVHGNSFIGTILMSPAYTGAMLEKMSAQLAVYFGVPGGAGLLVRSVEPNSPAALAGMQAGDVVVRADTRAVASTGDWAKAVKNSHGRPLTISVFRDKKEQTLTLTPDGKKRSSLDAPTGNSGGPAIARMGFSWVQTL